MLLAAFLLLIYQFFFKRKDFIVKKQHIIPMFIIGLTNVYLTNALEFWGLQFMTAGKACFIYSFSPIVTAILSYFIFSEKMTVQKVIGLGIGILGFIPILMTDTAIEDISGHIGPFSFAELALLGAASVSAIGWTVMRLLVKKQASSSVMANAGSMLIGGVFGIVHSLLYENWDPIPVTNYSSFLLWFLLLCLVSNIMAYNLNAVLLRRFTATYISFAGLSSPFFAALFGWFMLGEVMTFPFWVSLVVVILGLFIYYKEELRQGYIELPAKKSKR